VTIKVPAMCRTIHLASRLQKGGKSTPRSFPAQRGRGGVRTSAADSGCRAGSVYERRLAAEGAAKALKQALPTIPWR
jgi:hypothetical protein